MIGPRSAGEASHPARNSWSLCGRSAERRLLDHLLEAVRTGESRTLVIVGEPGIGKTALLEHTVAISPDFRIVQTVGVESEMELAYASLHQLCAPLLDRVERLPAPQHHALEIVFGLSAGAAPDRFLVGLAVLSLLSGAADECPLICLVDDAQWLDAASSQTLGFVARRLGAESVGVFFGTREVGPDLIGLPDLHVAGLSNRDARALLDSAMRGRLDERIKDRIVAETDGNPLALLELHRSLTPAQLAGGFGEPYAGALASRVEESFGRRLAALPAETRWLLLVAAAEPLGEPLLLWRAAERLGLPPSAADAAEHSGLLQIGSGVRFRHPLVRSAVYRSATPAERRRAHNALAHATDAESDPERRAWHRARGAAASDESIATELERSAGSAAARGGRAAAAAFLRQAAALSPEPADRARRALTAAEAEWQAGDPEAAIQILVFAEAGPLEPLAQARADLLRGRVAFSVGADEAARLLFDAAKRLEPLDMDRARETYLDALSAMVYMGPNARCDPIEVARAALAARRPGHPRPTDLLLDGIALQITEGYATATATLREAVRAFDSDDVPADVGLGWGWLASHVASSLWEHELQLTLARRHVRLVREAGALEVLVPTLAQLVGIYLRDGKLGEAAALTREMTAAGDATRSGPAVHIAMVTAAYAGLEAEGERLIVEVSRHLTPQSRGLGVVVVQFASLLLYNGLGRYEDALRHGSAALEDPEPVGRPPWAFPELVEAAARAGAPDLAARALQALSERAAISGTDWARGLEARSRALLSEGVTAERLYREAIERLARPGSRTDLARAHLVYGEWLRREGRRVDAREQLRMAHDHFRSIGMEAFAERARRERLATGEKARKRTVEARDDLTAQERQIAEFARDGLSNPEIGARLFLSPRTVEWHLRKVFGKLGIRSRHELAGAFAASASPR
ncbi:MAG: AAA family ATPase [Solirubrobacterales bacterium]|nr:AAA family ATPase [Solirubrobacterales bacterium]MBV9366557.1 AAA family ATPase [Solirubrobacterales bacterium]